MKYKLIALDIDDTIVQEASHIPSQKVMDALLQISKKIHVIISTARARSEFEVFKKNAGLPPNFNIVENGAKVLSPDGKVEYELTIPHNEIQKILNITEPYFDEVGFCIDENWDNEIRDTKDKAVNALSYTCTDELQGYLLKNAILDAGLDYNINVGRHWSIPGWGAVFVSHKKASKGKGLEYVQKKLNIKKEETIAIGDGATDLMMFPYAGLKVAMENGEKLLKDEADVICPPVSENGVLRIITEYILKEKI